MTMVEDGGGFYDWPPKAKPKTPPAPVAAPVVAPASAADNATTTPLRHAVTITAPVPVFKKRTL